MPVEVKEMRRLAVSIVLLLLLAACTTSKGTPYNFPEIQRVYDSDGHLVGKVHHYQDHSRVYDVDGKLLYKIR